MSVKQLSYRLSAIVIFAGIISVAMGGERVASKSSSTRPAVRSSSTDVSSLRAYPKNSPDA